MFTLTLLFFFSDYFQIGIGLMICQQFVGINGIGFYASETFASAGNSGLASLCFFHWSFFRNISLRELIFYFYCLKCRTFFRKNWNYSLCLCSGIQFLPLSSNSCHHIFKSNSDYLKLIHRFQ